MRTILFLLIAAIAGSGCSWSESISVVNHTTHVIQIRINEIQMGEIPPGQTRAYPMELERIETPTSSSRVAFVVIIARDLATNLQAVKKFQIAKNDPLAAEFFAHEFK